MNATVNTGYYIALGARCAVATTLSVFTLCLGAQALSAAPLLNIDFGQTESIRNTGPAAVGQGTNDFWNFYNRDGEAGEWRTLGALTHLKLADGTTTVAGLVVTNLPGCWGNGSADRMYYSYDYPFEGMGALSITNLASGEYDIYIYSHDGNYQLKVGATDLGTKTCRDTSREGIPIWEEGRQYVLFNKVTVNAGDAVILNIMPGLDGFAVISGMQLVRTADVPPSAPFLLDVDFGSGSGPSSKQGAAAVGQTNDFWNYYTRDEAGQWRSSGLVSNLTLANGTASGIAMLVENAPGAWSTQSLDPMYREFIYPFSGVATITVSNVPAGNYDLYVYSHDGNYQLTAGGTDLGSRSCRDANPSGTPVWQEGVQYVRFPGATVQPGGNLVLTVRPGADGFAIISGMQLMQTVVPPPAPVQANVDFGSGAGPSTKQGAAVVGQTNDFWNYYTRDEAGGWRTSGVLTNLTLANGASSQIMMSVSNAPGAWGTDSLDAMYKEYIYPFRGVATITVSQLPAGLYDFYVYSHDGNYQLTAGGTDFGSRSCRDGNPTGTPVWQEGVQYVRFAEVPISANGSLALTVRPGADGFAIISGLQIAPSAGISTNTAPVVVEQPQSQTVFAGSDIVLSVRALGSGPLSCQWRFNGTDIPGATNALYSIPSIQLAQAGTYAVKVANGTGAALSGNATVVVVQTAPANLVNIDFGQSESTRKTGPAAVGQSANDNWNFYNRDGEAGEWRTLGGLTNLKLADGTATLTGISVTNLPGSWGNGSADQMYFSYLYPFEGPGALSITNLASGEYDIYIYSHDGNYGLKAGATDLGTKTCRDEVAAGTPIWQEGRQYVLFKKAIVRAGDAVTLTILPGLDGYAVISGMQLVRTGDAPSPAPFLLDIDFGSGSGPSSKQGAAAVGQTNDFWNYYTRDEAGQWRSSGILSNLTLASGAASDIVLSVANAPGAWSTQSLDPMYREFIYPFSGVATVTVSNVPAGNYDIYVYSHDGNYQLTSSGTDLGSRSCQDTNSAGIPAWQEGVQYVRFAGVPVPNGGNLVLTVRPGVDGFAIISGLQIAQSSTTNTAAASKRLAMQSPAKTECVKMRFAGAPAVRYKVQASTDMIQWVDIGSVVADDQGRCEFGDQDSSRFSQRYYRIVAP